MVDSSQPLILEISSEEDQVFGDILTVDLDYDWISSLLNEDEHLLLSDDSPKKTKKITIKDDVDDDDDDCVILEDDPDKKPAEVRTHFDSEDLLIIGEKGQIACRDYPHPRHLCAKFLFASTPHEQHCLQCHCYVCDSLAPCIYWGTGTSNTDHCHSTHQDPFWKVQRESFKQRNKVPSLVPQVRDTPSLPQIQQAIQVPAVLTPDQNQLARLTAIRACATSTNSSSQILSRNKFNPRLVSHQLLNSFNNAIPNVGRQSPSNLGAQYFNRPSIFKRPGYNGVVQPTRRSGFGSLTNNNNISQYLRNPSPPLPGFSNRISTYRPPVVSPSQARITSQLNSFAGSVPSQPQPYNNQFNSFVNPVPNTNYSQNQVPSPSQVFSQFNMGNCFTLPSPEAYSQANKDRSLTNPVYPRTKTYNQPNCLQQRNETRNAVTSSSTNFLTNQYKQIENIPAQAQALACQQIPPVPQYDSSVIPDHNQLSYLCDPAMGGYVGNDEFDLCLPDSAIVDTIDTSPLFDYLDHPVF